MCLKDTDLAYSASHKYRSQCASLLISMPSHVRPALQLVARPGARLELPILIHRLDGPIELLPQSFREEALDRHGELLREDDREAGIDVIL